MNDSEFTTQLNTIKMISAQADTAQKELSSRNEEMYKNASALVSKLAQRDKSLYEYMDLLKEFSFSDNLTSPSDLFPGIRTVSDMADPEELLSKTNKMKTLADEVSGNNKEVDVIINTLIISYKKQLSTLIELSKLENQSYDLSMDLLKDLNSVYDIGQLASNT